MRPERPGIEPRFEAFDGLRCERYFRNEHDPALTVGQGVRERLQINLSLAAPRHSVEEKGRRWPLFRRIQPG